MRAGAILIIGWAAAVVAPWPGEVSAREPAAFRASRLLRPEVLRGRTHAVQELVGFKDGRYVFTLRTPHGPIEAQGLNMLELRLAEMQALEEVQRMARQPQELAGIKENIEKTGEGLHALLTDPLESIGSVPKGVGRKLESLTKRSTYAGGSESRRELAVRLGCDPETRNQPLRKKMDEVVLRRGLGKGLTTVATFGLTGGAALAAQGAGALRTTAEMRDVLRSTPLYKINEDIQAELVRAGVSREAAKAFARHEHFTTLQRLQFMAQLRRLSGAPGRAGLVEWANAAGTEADALGAIHAAGLLAGLHQRLRFSEVDAGAAPMGKLADGRWVALSAADYLVEGPEWTRILAGLHETRSAVLVAAGRVSPELRERIAGAGMTLIEGGRLEQVR